MLVIAIFAAAVLGYGWRHVSTHASFHGDFRLVGEQLSDRSFPISRPVLSGAEVRFIDVHGEVLATAINDAQHNYLHLIHPVVGDCHAIEKMAMTSSQRRNAWENCYEVLSTWTSTWIQQVRQVAVTHQDCSYGVSPVDVSEYYADWYLWWVPLPHVGGTPYRHYRLTIEIDESNCNA